MTNFDKIRTFNGKIAGKWMPPDNFRRWSAGANKLLKLHYRMMNSGLLWPELVTQLKDAIVAWEAIGVARYGSKIDPMYHVEFDGIKDFDVVRFLAFNKNIVKLLGDDKGQSFVEETRESHAGVKCQFCRAKLIKPAYIVRRIGPEVVHKSDPVGIMCLHSMHGKLKKLLELPTFTALLSTAQEAVTI